jgi:hypothetical protein
VGGKGQARLGDARGQSSSNRVALVPTVAAGVQADRNVVGGLTAASSPDVPVELGLTAPQQMGALIGSVREMVARVDNARDATLLVRRANAVEKTVGEALKTYSKLGQDQFRLRQEAAEAHLRTQRRAGELLMQMPRNRGGRRSKTETMHSGPSDQPVTLRELGVDVHESHRWQRIAAVSAKQFDDYINQCRAKGAELTTAGMLKLARQLVRDEADVERRPSSAPMLLREYDKLRKSATDLVWLDPERLASVMQLEQRAAELEHLRRLRLWLAELETALSRTASRTAPARQ